MKKKKKELLILIFNWHHRYVEWDLNVGLKPTLKNPLFLNFSIFCEIIFYLSFCEIIPSLTHDSQVLSPYILYKGPFHHFLLARTSIYYKKFSIFYNSFFSWWNLTLFFKPLDKKKKDNNNYFFEMFTIRI